MVSVTIYELFYLRFDYYDTFHFTNDNQFYR